MDALELVLKTSLALIVAGMITILLRHASASLRHQVWVVTLVGVIALPLVTTLLPWEWRILPVARPAATVVPGTALRISDDPLAPNTLVVQAPVVSQTERQTTKTTIAMTALAKVRDRFTPTWPRVLVGLWIVGGLVVVGRFIVGFLWLTQLRGRAEEIRSGTWNAAAERVARTLGLARPVALLRSGQVHTPLAYGILRPVVLLPSASEAWSDDQKHMVLVHEFAHVRRADVVSLCIARVACAIYWFNPLIWVATKRLRAEAERACDDSVLRTGARASVYAGHLMQMAGALGHRRVSHAPALPMASRSGFEGRLFAILAPNQDRNKLQRGHMIMNVAVMGGFIFTLGAMAPANVDRVAPTPPSPIENPLTSIALSANPNPVPESHVVARKVDTARTRKVEERYSDEPISFALEGTIAATTPRVSQETEDPRSVAALSRALRTDDDPKVRKMAAWALGQLEDPAAVEALSDALRSDADMEVRETAAWALGNIETRSAVAGLMTAIDDSDVRVRSTVVWALGQIQDRSAVEPLAKAITDADVSIRKTAVWALGQIEDRAAVPALTTVLSDEDEDVRQQAAWALGQIESSDAVEPLARALQDSDAGVRKQAAWALGQIESPRAVPALSDVLRGDDNASVRSTAAWALGQIESSDAVPALSEAMSDPSADVRKTAAWAIGQIEPQTAPQGLLDALQDEDAEVRGSAIWAVSQIEDPAAVDQLRTLMNDENPRVRRSAIWALSRVRDEAAVRALAELLDDDDPEVRRAAAAALGGRWQGVNPRPRPRPQPRPRPRPRPFGGF